ncbi:unnamed protein product [Malus baccata var. baccata]
MVGSFHNKVVEAAGLSFHGHDESDTSNNRGNYLELLQFIADHDEKIKVVLIAPLIKKDLVHSCSIETIKTIISDMKNARFFSLLVDEAHDVSIKEQMAVVLRVQHVPDTTSNTLKESIDAFIHFNELSFSNLRGQGYDSASNMKELMKALENDSFITGRGLNQETSLKCAGATRWNSHYGTLISLITIFSSVVNVLEMIVDDNTNDSVAEANRLLKDIRSFQFIFLLFLMKSILGITNDLSQALQKNDQEIVNAMALVNTCKEQLLYMRNDEGFDFLVDKVLSFCVQHHIEVINMDETYVAHRRSRRDTHKKTSRHHYKVELFFVVIDSQLIELNDRFNETSTELLICLASLSPNDSFVAFDKEKLLRLAQLYPQDFTKQDLLAPKDQLDIYIHSMRSRSDFSLLQSISDLAKKMVEKSGESIFRHEYHKESIPQQNGGSMVK